MARNVAVFTDVNDLFHSINAKYRRKLNYQMYLETVIEDTNLCVASAYCINVGLSPDKFLSALQDIGFDVQRVPCISYLIVDIIRLVEQYPIDSVILSSANRQLIPLISYLKEKNILCNIIACNIPEEVQAVANYTFEIPKEWLW